MTRRVGLRVKALFGGDIQPEWANILVLDLLDSKRDNAKATPTRARIAQATTIVFGGIAASLAAEMAGRPFKACQRIVQQARATEVSARHPNPIIYTLRTQGFRPFYHLMDSPLPAVKPTEKAFMSQWKMRRVAKRLGWRMAAVGPWGFGFLVWAWVGGEV